jgi:Holliday junction resolvase RusA-like endonuclease
MLHVVYRELPPTSNKIYFQGTRLTPKAREYAERFAHFMATKHGHEIIDIDPSQLYALHLRFFFETLVNEGWAKTNRKGQRLAQSPYKKVDLTNRVKLLEDCIRDAIGVDDSQTFAASLEKHHDPGNPRVEIMVHPVDPSIFGIPDGFRFEAQPNHPPGRR